MTHELKGTRGQLINTSNVGDIMNEKNNEALLKKENTLDKVECGIKDKMDKSFKDEVTFMGEVFPNVFTVDGEDVLGSQVPKTKAFKEFCLSFGGDANTYDNRVCTKTFKNGKGSLKWDWEEISQIKQLGAFAEEARGKIFFLARSMVLAESLKQEIEELKK